MSDEVVYQKSSTKKSYELNVLPRLAEITAWVREGLSGKGIATQCGISYPTYKKYRDEHPELDAAVRKGNMDFRAILDNHLVERITNPPKIRRVEVKREANGEGELEVVEEKVTVTEQLPSDGLLRLAYERCGALGGGMGGFANPNALPRAHAPEPEQGIGGPPPLRIFTYNDPDYIDVELEDGAYGLHADQAAE